LLDIFFFHLLTFDLSGKLSKHGKKKNERNKDSNKEKNTVILAAAITM